MVIRWFVTRWVLAFLPAVVVLQPREVLAQVPPEQSTTPTTQVCSIRYGSICSGLGRDIPAQPSRATPGIQAIAETGLGRRSTRKPSPYLRERTFLPAINGCINGQVYVDRIVSRATGETVNLTPNRCLADPRTPVPTVPAQAERPPPERVWSEVPLPKPDWGLNPGKNGLTGLPTWLWDPRGSEPVNATVDLGGFTATATARPIKYEWRMWESFDKPNRNPHPVVVSSVPGSEAKPAGTYIYETTGDWTVTMTVTWAGTYTFTGPGGVNDVVDLGTTTTSSSRPYHVIEVRGARVG